jgi:hypothetical protein
MEFSVMHCAERDAVRKFVSKRRVEGECFDVVGVQTAAPSSTLTARVMVSGVNGLSPLRVTEIVSSALQLGCEVSETLVPRLLSEVTEGEVLAMFGR